MVVGVERTAIFIILYNLSKTIPFFNNNKQVIYHFKLLPIPFKTRIRSLRYVPQILNLKKADKSVGKRAYDHRS